MCGRFTVASAPEEIAKHFGVEVPEDWQARYNAAPSQKLPVIRKESKHVEFFQWGLLPHWAKEKNIAYKMINARGETVDKKPSFRVPLRSRRCLVVADSFYEWQKRPEGKRPVRFLRKDKEPFAFAGLWENWKSPEGEEIYSFTIITTQANPLVAKAHNRMPVILLPEDETTWLQPETPKENLLQLLQPYPEEQMQAYPVSTALNNPRNDFPELLEETA